MDKSGRLGLARKSVARASSPASKGKAPRTARGEKTLRKILDAALAEFGQRGFHDSSIVGITGRAKVALGTFYTYFDSKEAVFAALVRDMSRQVRDYVAPDIEGSVDEIDRERRALASYLRFVFDHKEVYRIIDEAEFVDPRVSAPIMRPPPPALPRGSRRLRPRARCATMALSRPKCERGPSWG